MGTTAQKLEYLHETKQAIKQALVNKGATVADSDSFRSYATKIDNLNVAPSGWTALPKKTDLDNNTFLYDMDDFSWGAMLYLKALEGTSNMYASWKGTSKSFSFRLDGVQQNCSAKLVSSNYNGTEGLVFLVTGLSEKYSMFPTTDTSGGWASSALRKKLREEILPQLPEDLQEVLQTNQMPYATGGDWILNVASTANTKYCSDVLFVPSLGELNGNCNFSHNGVDYTFMFSEGTQFQWFAENAEDVAPTENTLTRTCTDSNTCAYLAENSTTANCVLSDAKMAVAFCFVI